MSKTDLVILELDRPRELRFGHKALKMIEGMFEKSLLEIVQEGINKIKPDMLEKIFYVGLMGDDKDLKLEDVEDLIDKTCYSDLLNKMIDAFNKTYGVEEIEEDNERFKKPKEDKKK